MQSGSGLRRRDALAPEQILPRSKIARLTAEMAECAERLPLASAVRLVNLLSQVRHLLRHAPQLPSCILLHHTAVVADDRLHI
jgi:hypothetical protein